ncbi:MAG: FAD-binding oxidoreductase [Rhodospirillaceae bacterium]
MGERVVIVGAGIVGTCTALSLLEKGLAVELIDRDPPAEGASHGNAGVISPWTCVPQSLPGLWKNVPKWLLDPEGPLTVRWRYLPRFLPWALKFLHAADPAGLSSIADAMFQLNRPNVDLYRRHLDGTGHENLVVDSYYVHAFREPAAADLKQLAWRLREERGVPLEVVGAGPLHEIEPALSPAYKAAVLMKGQGRAMDPGAVGKALCAKALAMGATERRAAVLAVHPATNGGWVVTTNAGDVVADKVVIAAGVWSARLLAPLGFEIPLEAERGYHMIFRDPGITLNNSIMDTEGKFVASSMNTGVRCAGTAEFAGIDAAPNYRRSQVFVRLAKRLFPDINTESQVEWMGRRPSFPDSLPCLGEIPGYRGLYAAFGHSHYGFGMAPNTGRVVAELVSGGKPNIPMEPYSITRFK